MVSLIIQEMANDLGLSIIHESQLATDQTLPYGTYSITEVNNEKPHQAIRDQDGADNSMVGVKHYYKRKITVHVDFFYSTGSEQDPEVAINAAHNALAWLNEKGRAFCKSHEAVPALPTGKVISEVTDEAVKKLRAGFEFSLVSHKLKESSVEAITGVDYTITIGE